MKKITLLFLCFMSTFLMEAQVFPEGFESGVPPANWTSFRGTNGEGDGFDWTTSTTAASGSQAAFVRYENVANEAEDWLVTPQFTPTAATNILTFQQRQAFNNDWSSTYTIRVSTVSQTTHTDFTIVDTQVETDFGLVYSTHNVDLSAYNDTPIYVAFVLTNDDGDSWYIDDVDLIANASPPDCASNPTPADAATGVDVLPSGNIAIAWDAPTTGDAPTGYEVFWGTTSGDLTSLGNLTATSVEITNGQFSTTYYWMIVPNNVGGSATGCTEWSFTTEDPPPAPANDLPSGAIAMTLDEGTACGANSITGISNTSTTDSGVTAPACGNYTGSTDYGDLWYTVVAPASGQITFNTENINGLTSVAGAFYSGTVGSLTEEDCTEFNSGWPWTVGSLTPGETYYLRVWDFGNDQNGTFDLCGYFQSCLDVTDVAASVTSATEATISWVAGASETSWNYEYGVTGFTQGSGTTGTASAATVDLSGLTDGETYDIYVQADCGSGSTSGWVLFTWTQIVPPANDDCTGAIALTVNTDGSCDSVTAGTTVGATASSQADDVSGTPNTDVWFSFVATDETQTVQLLNVVNQGGGTSTSTDMGMGVYNGTAGCNSLVFEATSDPNTLTMTGLTVSDTYYVRVYGWFTSVQYNNFDICVRAPAPPPMNDACADATVIGSLPFNETGDASGATNNDGFISICGSGMNDGVWYTFTTVDAGTVDISVSGNTGWDSEIAIYSGSCGALVCVDNVDSSGTSSTETLSGVPVDANTQYWVNIGQWSGSTDNAEGPYTIDVTTTDTTTLDVDSNTLEGFSLFPTIVRDELNFSAQENVDQISIYNLIGQEVLRRSPNVSNSFVDVTSLKGGIYIVKVQIGDTVGTYKIIKE